jgi:hypothetical protein
MPPMQSSSNQNAPALSYVNAILHKDGKASDRNSSECGSDPLDHRRGAHHASFGHEVVGW